MKFSKILLLLISAFGLRLILSFFGTLELDQNTFMAWSANLASNGFSGFYHGWSDYLPGYLYVLWLLGKLRQILPGLPPVLLYKLPAMLADILTGYLIYKIVKKLKNLPAPTGEKWGLVAGALYLFNPAILANSALWGQVDSLTALFSMLTIYFLEKNYLLSSAFLAIGVLAKPQAALAALVVLFVALRDKWKLKKYLAFGFLALLFFIIAFLPFSSGGNFLLFIYQRIVVTLNQYPYTSVNAFSLWGLAGFWKADRGLVAPSLVGGILVIVLSLAVGLKLLKSEKKVRGGEYFLLSVVFLAGFLFMTRMHERHLLPVFAPLIISSVLISDLYLPYLSLSVTYLANLYYAYIWITDKFKEVFTPEGIKLLIILNLISIYILFKRIWAKNLLAEGKLVKIYKIFLGFVRRNEAVMKEKAVAFPEIKMSKKLSGALLVLIIIFAFFTRVCQLNRPPKEYFDEVYHAFTARLVLHADPKAWEWWNPHPEGFAYEWTHPPLAKLAMALGMSIFGENAFGWRIPGALLGTGCVFLVYLLSKYLFKDEVLALISAFVFSLDGLVLTMSRIGMNDTYFLFFTLLAIYLFWKDKNFLSALAFGLAVSSKWSAIYSVPIFLASFFLLKKKFGRGLLWFLILPPLIYIGSYFQLFLTGHAFDIFTGVQKQMWWYHTNLKATHPYTSAWWTWPFLIRPVYLYTSEEVGGWVARIYNLGNPAVFWFGLIAVAEAAVYAFLERNRKLILLVFSYLIFFAPWALSPRIMFFYHYLPSLPFLVIAMGYFLRRNPKLIVYFLVPSALLFLYFYPHWAGLQIPLWWDKSYYWFSSWR